MRIAQRLKRIEELLDMESCALCRPGAEHDLLIVFWPNGFATPPRVGPHGHEIPDHCPGCGRSLADRIARAKHLTGDDPAVV